jgi:uncharacterized protein
MWFRVVATVFCSMFAGQATAQEWFTADACSVTSAEVAGVALPADLVARIGPAADEMLNGRGRLWRITTPEGAVSHLWGTYHTPDPLLLDLPTAFRTILQEARVVALEFDPIPEDRVEAAANADSGWMWSVDGSTDWSFVPPKVMGWIEARLDAIGWGTAYLGQLSEVGLASLLLSDPCGDFMAGFLPGQDSYIAQEAFLAGAEVTGLQQCSDFNEQLGAPGRSEEAQAVILLYASYLGPGSATDNDRALSYRLYLEGRMAELDLWDIDFMSDLHGAVEGERLVRQARSYLVVERNEIFVRSAMPLLREGGAVIAVGAGHLAGTTGLVEMLRAEGLLVERVALPGEAP